MSLAYNPLKNKKLRSSKIILSIQRPNQIVHEKALHLPRFRVLL